jgi:hypothetical protein
MPRGQVHSFAPIPLDSFRTEIVPAEQPAPFQAEGTRDETQREIDVKVLANYLHWQTTGSPDFTRADLSRPGGKVQRVRFLFPPEHTEAVQIMLRRAAHYNGCTVIQSDVKAHQDGSAMIYWAARAPRARASAAESNGSE